MDCLQGYIGIQGCGAPAAPTVPDPLPAGATSEDYFSGLYINQLPGVNLEVIESIADDEQENFLGVWADVQTRALKKFALAVKAELNKCYSICDPTVVNCIVCENKDLFAVALWYFLGVELMIERTASTRLNRFTTIDVDAAEKLKSDFYTEFQGALKDAVSSINPNDSDCITGGCVDCGGPARFVEQTP
jgi:hypothetical protein